MRWVVDLTVVATTLGQRSADADTPVIDAGIRMGFAEQTHTGGRTPFTGSGVELGIEAGVRVRPALSLRVGFERGPQLSRQIPYTHDGDVSVRDIAVIGVAELDLDPFFVGVGGGWTQESATEIIWGSDSRGPTGPVWYTQTPSGELGLARAGWRMVATDQFSVNLVMQLTAQRIAGRTYVDGPSVREHAYGASLGIELGGPPGKAPALERRDLPGRWFVGADVGLMDSDTASFDGPTARLGVGAYVIPAIALQLGGAATLLPSNEHQLQLTLGAEAHRGLLFASAGGGLSHYTTTSSSDDSPLVYVGTGVEVPSGLVRYRCGAELSMSDFLANEYYPDRTTIYALTLTFGVRLTNAL